MHLCLPPDHLQIICYPSQQWKQRLPWCTFWPLCLKLTLSFLSSLLGPLIGTHWVDLFCLSFVPFTVAKQGLPFFLLNWWVSQFHTRQNCASSFLLKTMQIILKMSVQIRLWLTMGVEIRRGPYVHTALKVWKEHLYTFLKLFWSWNYFCLLSCDRSRSDSSHCITLFQSLSLGLK